MTNIVITGDHAIDTNAITAMRWEGDQLYVDLCSGRFALLGGRSAKALWNMYTEGGVDLSTGEVLETKTFKVGRAG